MIDQSTLEGKVITAAFDLAASPGWADVSLRDIADAAGCSLVDVMEHFADKDDVLVAFSKHVDRAMLAKAGDVEREQSPRDAIFEVIMSRFDVMMPYKAGLRSIVSARSDAFPPDPGRIRMTLKTQNKILQAAGVSSDSRSTVLRQLGLARIYGQVMRIWLDDDDAGMARTMAALDKRLRQGEQAMRTLDDVANSAERACQQAEQVATRILAGLRASVFKHRDDEPDATPGDTGAETDEASSTTGDMNPGMSPTTGRGPDLGPDPSGLAPGYNPT